MVVLVIAVLGAGLQSHAKTTSYNMEVAEGTVVGVVVVGCVVVAVVDCCLGSCNGVTCCWCSC